MNTERKTYIKVHFFTKKGIYASYTFSKQKYLKQSFLLYVIKTKSKEEKTSDYFPSLIKLPNEKQQGGLVTRQCYIYILQGSLHFYLKTYFPSLVGRKP